MTAQRNALELFSLIGIARAAEMVGLSVRTFSRRAEVLRLKPIRVGRNHFWTPRQVAEVGAGKR